MGRNVIIKDNGFTTNYSDEELDKLKEILSGIIEDHRKKLFDVTGSNSIVEGTYAHDIRLKADQILRDLKAKIINTTNSHIWNK